MKARLTRFFNSNVCGRWVTASLTQTPLVSLYSESTPPPSPSERSGTPGTTTNMVGPQLPPIQADEKMETFRRVKLFCPTEPIRDIEDAYSRLGENPNHPTANAFIGLELLRVKEEHRIRESTQDAIGYLEAAIKSGNLNQNIFLQVRI